MILPPRCAMLRSRKTARSHPQEIVALIGINVLEEGMELVIPLLLPENSVVDFSLLELIHFLLELVKVDLLPTVVFLCS